MKAATARALLVAGTLVLAVLLFIAPRTTSAKSESAKPAVVTSADLSVYVTMGSRSLEPAAKSRFEKLLKEELFDSLAAFWQSVRRPDLAAFYTERSARRTDTSGAWMLAGNRYYYAVQYCQDRTEIPVLYASAARCFRKALALDPSNTDARIMAASCMVEGPDPMQGIAMLREVEKADSMNLKLQLTFATFSMKSGQLDKAAERFRKALRADSTYIETYLHLADVYEQLGETGRSIEMLEAFEARTGDPAARTEVKKYIEQLKKRK